MWTVLGNVLLCEELSAAFGLRLLGVAMSFSFSVGGDPVLG